MQWVTKSTKIRGSSTASNTAHESVATSVVYNCDLNTLVLRYFGLGVVPSWVSLPSKFLSTSPCKSRALRLVGFGVECVKALLIL
jgi:hypothetical protein